MHVIYENIHKRVFCSTNRRTTHLAGRRRQPLTPQTCWASPAEPLAPRHMHLPLTPSPRVSPASANEDTRSLTSDIIPHDTPHKLCPSTVFVFI